MSGTLRSELATAAQALGLDLPKPPPNGRSTEPISVIDKLTHGGVVVVVGGRTTNFTEAMRRHPQFVFWDSTDPRTESRALPSNVRAVLVTRFVSHRLEERVRVEARAKAAYCPPGHLSTGDVREVLEPVLLRPSVTAPRPVELPIVAVQLPVAPPPVIDTPVIATTPPVAAEEPPDMSPSVTLRGPKRGELAEFILAHADPDAPRTKEAERLVALMAAKGMTSPVPSVGQGIWRLQDKIRRRNQRAANKIDRQTGPFVITRDNIRSQPPVASTGRTDLLDEALNEADRYIAEAKAAMDLLGELIPRLRKGLSKVREQQQAIRKMAAEASTHFLE